MNTTHDLVRRALGVCILLTAIGCGSPPEPTPPPTTVAVAVAPPPSVAPHPAAPTASTVPVPADFRAEAARTITPATVQAQLTAMEAELTPVRPVVDPAPAPAHHR